MKINKNSFKGVIAYITFLSISISACCAAEVSVYKKDMNNDGKEDVILENSVFALTIAPDFGGQGISLFLKKEKVELVPDKGLAGGLFIDHDARQQPWPGEFFKAGYIVNIPNYDKTKSGSVELSCTGTGEWQGGKYPDIKDLIIKKTITIYPDCPVIDVMVEVTNKGEKGKLFDYWVQHIVSGAGNPSGDLYFRPAVEGISEGKAEKKEFIYTPADAWMAVIDPNIKKGIAFVMDYNYLKTLYNCLSAFTTEWFYDRASIPAGAAWNTTYSLVLISGFQKVSYASKNIIADLNLEEAKDKSYSIKCLFQSARRDLKDLHLDLNILNKGIGAPKYRMDTVQGKLVEIEEKPKEELKQEDKIKHLTFEPVSLVFAMPDREPGLRIVNIEIKGDNIWDIFEMPIKTGETKAAYTRKLPPKEKVFLKPPKIEISKDNKLDVLYIYEPFANKFWNIEDIVKTLNKENIIKKSEISCSAWKGSAELSYFPSGYEELLSYDLIIMQAQDMIALGALGQEMIKDYVNAGGNLFLLGGYYSYGKGRPEEGKTFCEILPVELNGPWDLTKAEDKKAKAVKSNPITKDMSSESFPITWYHRVKEKSNAETLLSIDNGYPLLVSGKYGKGNIICFTGTPFGEDYLNYSKDQNYNKLITNIIKYLSDEIE